MTKFNVIIFYENEKKLDWYLRNFKFDDPIKKRKSNDETYIAYEHFELKCFKSLPTERFRGHKCDMVAVEKSIYELPEFRTLYECVICGMLVPQRFEIDIQVFG